MSLNTFALTRGPVPDQPDLRRPSTLINRNVTVAGHRTSVRLESVMWDALRQISERENKPMNAIVTEIARRQVESSLTAAIRVYLLRYFRDAAVETGRLQMHAR